MEYLDSAGSSDSVPIGAFEQEQQKASQSLPLTNEDRAQAISGEMKDVIRNKLKSPEGRDEMRDICFFAAAVIATAAQTKNESSWIAKYVLGFDLHGEDLGKSTITRYLLGCPGALEYEISRFYVNIWDLLPAVVDDSIKEGNAWDPDFITDNLCLNPVIPSSALGLASTYLLKQSLISEEWWQWLEGKTGDFLSGVIVGGDLDVLSMLIKANGYQRRAIWLGVVLANILDIIPDSHSLVSLAADWPHDERTLYGRLLNQRSPNWFAES